MIEFYKKLENEFQEIQNALDQLSPDYDGVIFDQKNNTFIPAMLEDAKNEDLYFPRQPQFLKNTEVINSKLIN